MNECWFRESDDIRNGFLEATVLYQPYLSLAQDVIKPPSFLSQPDQDMETKE